jgi:hypothetical protein
MFNLFNDMGVRSRLAYYPSLAVCCDVPVHTEGTNIELLPAFGRPNRLTGTKRVDLSFVANRAVKRPCAVISTADSPEASAKAAKLATALVSQDSTKLLREKFGRMRATLRLGPTESWLPSHRSAKSFDELDATAINDHAGSKPIDIPASAASTSASPFAPATAYASPSSFFSFSSLSSSSPSYEDQIDLVYHSLTADDFRALWLPVPSPEDFRSAAAEEIRTWLQSYFVFVTNLAEPLVCQVLVLFAYLVAAARRQCHRRRSDACSDPAHGPVCLPTHHGCLARVLSTLTMSLCAQEVRMKWQNEGLRGALAYEYVRIDGEGYDDNDERTSMLSLAQYFRDLYKEMAELGVVDEQQQQQQQQQWQQWREWQQQQWQQQVPPQCPTPPSPTPTPSNCRSMPNLLATPNIGFLDLERPEAGSFDLFDAKGTTTCVCMSVCLSLPLSSIMSPILTS